MLNFLLLVLKSIHNTVRNWISTVCLLGLLKKIIIILGLQDTAIHGNYIVYLM